MANEGDFILELEYSEALNWYYDIVHLSTMALGLQDFDDYEFYEDWRRALKGAFTNDQ